MKKEKKSVLAAAIVLAVIFGIFAGLFIYAQPEKEAGTQPDVYAEYEKGKVTQILMENIWEDEVAEKAWRGEQTLLVEIQTGQYAGESLMVSNAVGPMYGEAAKVGRASSLSSAPIPMATTPHPCMNTTVPPSSSSSWASLLW